MIEHRKDTSQKIELRDRIVTKAGDSFMKYGIKSITMDEIAASLGISKRTLYEVFEDKESLLKECVLRNQQEMNLFVAELLARSTNVLEVILMCYKRSIERFHKTNKRFFEDLQKYPQVNQLMKNYRDKDSDSTLSFFKMGIEQGIIRGDVNFAIVNLLVREQINLLMNTDICKEYSFLEVYESIMFTYIRGISTVQGAKVLDDFIIDHKKGRESQPSTVSIQTKKN